METTIICSSVASLEKAETALQEYVVTIVNTLANRARQENDDRWLAMPCTKMS